MHSYIGCLQQNGITLKRGQAPKYFQPLLFNSVSIGWLDEAKREDNVDFYVMKSRPNWTG
jgi:hypothetical protein